MNELLKLDWRKRVNAIDALKHPYFRNDPLPAQPGSLPTFEESHELDRRKFRSQKAAPPPAPKGGTVGMGPTGGWGGEAGGGANSGFVDNYGGMNRSHHNSSRHPNQSHGGYRPEGPPPPPPERRPAWQRDTRLDTRLPPRPPPANNHANWGGGSFDGSRSERPEYRERDRDRPIPRSRGAGGPPGGVAASRDIDTYIPSYGPDSGRREDRPREDRRRWEDRDDRRHDRERDRLEYDDRGRNERTRSRSRSPVRDRERDRLRERDPLGREREVYRR